MIIAWWSGGITSAVACKIALNTYDNVKVVMLDTMNEHEDTYRFLSDCEKWYGCKIDIYKNPKYNSIEEVWYKFKSLASATGAICSTELKQQARQLYCKENNVTGHVFGFENDPKEINRANNFTKHNEGLTVFYPLIEQRINKVQAKQIVIDAGLEIPVVYDMGYNNNNCNLSGCTMGGLGYWEKIRKEEPFKYNRMAQLEHDLSELKGEPVVICHNQAKDRVITKWDKSKKTGKSYSKSKLFLRFNPMFPEIPTADTVKGRHESVFECNGFCGIDENQIDFLELMEMQNE